MHVSVDYIAHNPFVQQKFRINFVGSSCKFFFSKLINGNVGAYVDAKKIDLCFHGCIKIFVLVSLGR